MIWDKELAADVPWADAYASVERHVKGMFGAGDLRRFTTAELVAHIYPASFARGEGVTARKRLFKALKALADHQLKDYWEPGEKRPLKHNPKQLVTPKIWRAPPAKLRIARWAVVGGEIVAETIGAFVRYEDIKEYLP